MIAKYFEEMSQQRLASVEIEFNANKFKQMLTFVINRSHGMANKIKRMSRFHVNCDRCSIFASFSEITFSLWYAIIEFLLVAYILYSTKA